jgi:hypothetical protein
MPPTFPSLRGEVGGLRKTLATESFFSSPLTEEYDEAADWRDVEKCTRLDLVAVESERMAVFGTRLDDA